jgi:hypothetical protein
MTTVTPPRDLASKRPANVKPAKTSGSPSWTAQPAYMFWLPLLGALVAVALFMAVLFVAAFAVGAS